MRIFTIVFFTLFLYQVSLSQSFRVDSENKVSGSIGSEVKAVLNIRNLTNKTLHLQIKRISSQLGSSQISYFCWGNECFDKSASSLSSSKIIEPGSINSKFASVLETGLVESNSSVKYLIYNVNNPADSVVHEVSYVIEDQNSKKILFHNRDIQISNIYPNPVNSYAFLNYTISPKKNNAKIVIHNVLGGIVAEYVIPPHETRLKISTGELNPGIYFYTLRIDNENLITKKLVIKR